MSNVPNTTGLSFDDIADKFVAELRDGGVPSITDYVEKFPEYTDQIKDLFPILFDLESHQKN